MLTAQESARVEDAGRELMPFILRGTNWVQHPRVRDSIDYTRRVGRLSINASIDVTPSLDVYLRVAFRAPGLSPMKASDLLEAFLRERIPLTPHSEWQVEVDSRQWIHFSRRWVGAPLSA